MNWFDFMKNYEGSIKVNGQKEEKTKYRITVKGWMSNNSGNLDFHQRWNNGICMPLKTMIGTIIAETPGMWKMDLVDENGENHWVGFVSKTAIINMEEI